MALRSCVTVGLSFVAAALGESTRATQCSTRLRVGNVSGSRLRFASPNEEHHEQDADDHQRHGVLYLERPLFDERRIRKSDDVCNKRYYEKRHTDAVKCLCSYRLEYLRYVARCKQR